MNEHRDDTKKVTWPVIASILIVFLIIVVLIFAGVVE
jgi:preprotein translocase subunit SecE